MMDPQQRIQQLEAEIAILRRGASFNPASVSAAMSLAHTAVEVARSSGFSYEVALDALMRAAGYVPPNTGRGHG